MRFNSLAFRLFATSAVWTLIVLPIAGFIIYSLYRDDVQASFDAQLKKLATALAIDSMGGAVDKPLAPTNRYEPLFEVTQSGWYWQIRPLDDPKAPTLVSASLATSILQSPFERKFPTDDTGTRWMNVAGPNDEPTRIVELVDTLDHEPGRPRYSIIVAGPLDWLEALVANFRNRLTIALTLAGLGLVAVTLFQVRFGLLPLKRVERGLAAIRSGKAERLEGDLPAEIAPLQTELNALIRSNQDIVERARTQVGNLAHALKTPLAVILNEAREDDTSPFAAKVAEQAQIMKDSVTLYLDRARMAARVGVIGRVTDVAEVCEPMVRALERINRDRGVRINFVPKPGVLFQGERQDLEEMLGNLLDNACKWSRTRVYLSASVVAGAKPGVAEIEIVVEDDGPGLTPEQRARIGKRGLRLDETKPGSGLGLSIVTELVQMYRSSLVLDRSRHEIGRASCRERV